MKIPYLRFKYKNTLVNSRPDLDYSLFAILQTDLKLQDVEERFQEKQIAIATTDTCSCFFDSV